MNPCADCAALLEGAANTPPHSQLERLGLSTFGSTERTQSTEVNYRCLACGARLFKDLSPGLRHGSWGLEQT